MILLKNWSITTKDPYIPPEASKRYLQGNVYGHCRKEDGTFVRTSSIKKINSKDRMIITSSGSIYKLGEIDPEYEKLYPGAEKMLFLGGCDD